MPTWKEIDRRIGSLFEPTEIYLKVRDIPAHSWHFDRGIEVQDDKFGLCIHRVEGCDDDFLPEDIQAEIRDAYPGAEIIPVQWLYDSFWLNFRAELKLLVE